MDKPKRRKYKDNPYSLLYNKDLDKYFIIFKNSNNVMKKVEVTFAIYDVFNCSELHDLSEMNEYDNHIEHLELGEEEIYLRTKYKPLDMDDEIIKKTNYESLMSAINLLPEIQKRRIKKYYFDEMTQQQIADEEGVDIRSIQYSLGIALKKLKKLLDKTS